MNTDRIAEISKKIASSYINDCNSIKSFEMTEDEWKKYSELHPHAERENHRIIQKKSRTRKNNKNENGKGNIKFGIPPEASLFQEPISSVLKSICKSKKYNFLFERDLPKHFIVEFNQYNKIKNEITNFDRTKGDLTVLGKLIKLERDQRRILNRFVENKANLNMEKLAVDNHMALGNVEIVRQSPYPSAFHNYQNDTAIFKEIYPIVFETVNRFCKMFDKQYHFNERNNLKIYISDTIDRPKHNDQDNVICLNASLMNVSFVLDNTKKAVWRFSIPSMAHELAHNMEAMNSHIRKRCVEFLNYRTSKETPVSLNKLWLENPHVSEDQKLIYPNGPYKPDEVAKPDNFFDPYCGKIYDDGMTEIFSMGIEYLIANPEKFNQIDPEYFYFIIGLMRGEL